MADRIVVDDLLEAGETSEAILGTGHRSWVCLNHKPRGKKTFLGRKEATPLKKISLSKDVLVIKKEPQIISRQVSTIRIRKPVSVLTRLKTSSQARNVRLPLASSSSRQESRGSRKDASSRKLVPPGPTSKTRIFYIEPVQRGQEKSFQLQPLRSDPHEAFPSTNQCRSGEPSKLFWQNYLKSALKAETRKENPFNLRDIPCLKVDNSSSFYKPGKSQPKGDHCTGFRSAHISRNTSQHSLSRLALEAVHDDKPSTKEALLSKQLRLQRPEIKLMNKPFSISSLKAKQDDYESAEVRIILKKLNSAKRCSAIRLKNDLL